MTFGCSIVAATRVSRSKRAWNGIGRALGSDDLERDGAAQGHLGGPADHSHALAAGDSFDAATGERRLEDQLGHGLGV